MSRLAMTYCHHFMTGYSHIDIHDSAEKAEKFFREHAQIVFSRQINWEHTRMKPLDDNGLGIHVGMTSYFARFLSPQEVEIYKSYGDKARISNQTGYLIAPE